MGNVSEKKLTRAATLTDGIAILGIEFPSKSFLLVACDFTAHYLMCESESKCSYPCWRGPVRAKQLFLGCYHVVLPATSSPYTPSVLSVIFVLQVEQGVSAKFDLEYIFVEGKLSALVPTPEEQPASIPLQSKISWTNRKASEAGTLHMYKARSGMSHVVCAPFGRHDGCERPSKLSQAPLQSLIVTQFPTRFGNARSLARRKMPMRTFLTKSRIPQNTAALIPAALRATCDHAQSSASRDAIGQCIDSVPGHCADARSGQPPRGLQFTLGTRTKPDMFDTIVMANLVSVGRIGIRYFRNEENFLSCLTRNITPHSAKNLAFHSLLTWKIILPILTTSLIQFSLGVWGLWVLCVFAGLFPAESLSRRVDLASSRRAIGRNLRNQQVTMDAGLQWGVRGRGTWIGVRIRQTPVAHNAVPLLTLLKPVTALCLACQGSKLGKM